MIKKILPEVWCFRSCEERLFAGKAEMVLSFLREYFLYFGNAYKAGASEDLVQTLDMRGL
jgi:hypothetical protein